MRKLFFATLIILLAQFTGNAQQLSETELTARAQQQANRLAQRMADTLGLTSGQKDSIYAISFDLIRQSQEVFRQGLPTDSLQPRLQRIERSRDRLYLPVLGNEKYFLYRSKKLNVLFGS